MKLFTSDLDRTLIFSERTVGQKHSITCVEHVEGNEQSFMSDKEIAYLKELEQSTYIVPVTTRSQQQYERVKIFEHTIVPKYAVMANGGIVLKDGQRDAQWDELVQQSLRNPLPVPDFKGRFEKQRTLNFFLREYEVEGLFYMLAVDEGILRHEELQLFQQELAAEGWASYLHGRKFYALPTTLTKEAAVQYVCDQLPHTLHIAAGDSLMDLGMMELADIGYTPKHGEVYMKLGEHTPVEVVLEEGVVFAETILQRMLKSEFGNALEGWNKITR